MFFEKVPQKVDFLKILITVWKVRITWFNIPETFKKFVVLQAIEVGHNISSDNWTTTIRGPMRVAMNKIREED